MNYTVWEGTVVYRLHRGRWWETVVTTRTAHYTDVERAPSIGGLPEPPGPGPYTYFRLPMKARPWILLAAPRNRVQMEADETETVVIDPDYFSPRIVKKQS